MKNTKKNRDDVLTEIKRTQRRDKKGMIRSWHNYNDVVSTENKNDVKKRTHRKSKKKNIKNIYY